MAYDPFEDPSFMELLTKHMPVTVGPDTVCARCLKTFRKHIEASGDCGEFTPCIDMEATNGE